MATLEQINNIKGSPYRFLPVITQQEDDIFYEFYAPRARLNTTYDDNIVVQYDGKYSLPVLTYKAYKNTFGEDAVRLWWVILEFSNIQSIVDIEIGTTLVFPSPSRIKNIIK